MATNEKCPNLFLPQEWLRNNSRFSSRADPESGSTGIRGHPSPQTLGLGLGAAGENMAQPNSSISKSYGIDIRSPEAHPGMSICYRRSTAEAGDETPHCVGSTRIVRNAIGPCPQTATAVKRSEAHNRPNNSICISLSKSRCRSGSAS